MKLKIRGQQDTEKPVEISLEQHRDGEIALYASKNNISISIAFLSEGGKLIPYAQYGREREILKDWGFELKGICVKTEL